jgi:hypothetical protein
MTYTDDQLISISYRICRFMMREFISISDGYHVKDGHLTEIIELCDWKDKEQARLHKIHDKFKNICKL